MTPIKHKIIHLIGDINLDMSAQIATLPRSGEDVIVREMRSQLGGGMVNSAVTLAHLGYQPILLGCYGDDTILDPYWEPLRLHGVNTHYLLKRREYPTGVIFIAIADDYERTMYSSRGANSRLTPEDISLANIASSDWLHISGYALLESPQREAVWKAAQTARMAEIPISLDLCPPAIRLNLDQVQEILPQLTVCIVDETDALTLCDTDEIDTAITDLLRSGIRLVAIKRGEKGCILAKLEENRIVSCSTPGFTIQVVDTTGAGDGFCGGIIFGCLENLNLPSIGLISNAIGGLAAARYGAGLAMPGLQELIAFLHENILDDEYDDLDHLFKILNSMKTDFNFSG